MTRCLLVRHGQSEWNASGRWQGHADPELSALGVEQARVAAGALSGVDAVSTSDLARARATAEIVATALGVEVHVDDRWRERAAGPWEGLTREEIEASWPGYLDSGRRPPGYEADASVAVRARAAFGDVVRANPEGVLLVVTHAGIVRTLERSLGGAAPPLANLAGRWVYDGREGPVLGARVELLGGELLTIPDEP